MLEPGNFEYKKLIERFEEMVLRGEEYFFDVENFEDISDYYVQFGKDESALKSLNIGLKQHPFSTDLLIRRAQVHLDLSHLLLADQDLKAAENIDPDNADLLIARAEWLSKRGQHNKAIQKLKRAGTILESFEEVNPMIASEYLELADYRRAAKYFKEVLLNDYDDGSALFSLSFCYDMLDESDELVSFLKMYIDNNPYSELAWHQLGLVYQKNKQFELAIDAFDFACVIDEYFSAAHYEKARAHEMLGQFDNAIGIYKSLIEVEDFNAYAYLRMGMAYRNKGDLKQAKRFMTKAYIDDPELEDVLLNMVQLHEELEEWREAICFINKLTSSSDTPGFLFYSAIIHQKAGLIDESVEILDILMDNNDCPVEAYLLYADLMLELEDINDSLDVLYEAIDRYPKEPHIFLRLGIMLFELHELDEAVFYVTRAYNMDKVLVVDYLQQFPHIANHTLIKRITD
ncbi:MAG: tetratricopeptide repeat protein [Cryomorphaceae bacterium]|nr:tetratricopeptide repeat protein [Cryomorphaceae bacterium]